MSHVQTQLHQNHWCTHPLHQLKEALPHQALQSHQLLVLPRQYILAQVHLLVVMCTMKTRSVSLHHQL